MSETAPTNALPYGLLELDDAGTVRHYCPAREKDSAVPKSEVVGRNFFTDVLPVERVKDFQARFHSFMARGEATHRFSTTFAFDGNAVKVQIMLTYVSEQSEQGRERLALVRIMPAPAEEAAPHEPQPLFVTAQGNR